MKRISTLLIILFASLGVHAQDFATVIQSVDQAQQQKQYAAAIKILADARVLPELTPAQRKDLGFRIANYIHYGEPSVFPIVRDEMEKFLKSEPLDDAEKHRVLSTIQATCSRLKDHDGFLAAGFQTLDLSLPDETRAKALAELAQFYIHQLRKLDEGRKCYHECIVILRKQADSTTNSLEKAEKLVAIGGIYQAHTQEPDLAVSTYREAEKTYLAKMPNTTGMIKIKTLMKLGNLYRALGDSEAAEKCEAQVVSEYRTVFDSAQSLPQIEWIKIASESMGILRNSEAGCRLAIEIADKMIAMGVAGEEDAFAKERRMQVLTQAESICRSGKVFEFLKRVSYFVEKQVSISGNPSAKIRLAECYFRIDRDLEKARRLFSDVAATPDADPKVREEARLWLQMLSDPK